MRRVMRSFMVDEMSEFSLNETSEFSLVLCLGYCDETVENKFNQKFRGELAAERSNQKRGGDIFPEQAITWDERTASLLSSARWNFAEVKQASRLEGRSRHSHSEEEHHHHDKLWVVFGLEPASISGDSFPLRVSTFIHCLVDYTESVEPRRLEVASWAMIRLSPVLKRVEACDIGVLQPGR